VTRPPIDRRIVLITGPTAVGKTDVAFALADLLGGNQKVSLISVDSAMVYRGMDVGSAKPTPAELEQYPHALVDIRDPENTYTAADFVADADACVAQAFSTGRLPVLVGGTMLYAKRFIEGIAHLPKADPALRAELAEVFARQGGAELHAELRAVDPAAAAQIHPNNPQRLLRALEVVRLTGRPMSEQWQEHGAADVVQRLRADIVACGVVPDDRQKLHERIAARFDSMLAHGFEDELRRLAARPGITAALPAMRAVGYRQGLAYVTGALDAQGFRDQATTATRRLAKRQLTWLRRWPDMHHLYWGDARALAQHIERLVHG
jgi:tRNA dimethylallyltransferase